MISVPFIVSIIISSLIRRNITSSIVPIFGIIYLIFSVFNGWGHSPLTGYNPGLMNSIKEDKTAQRGMMDLEEMICGLILILISIFM